VEGATESGIQAKEEIECGGIGERSMGDGQASVRYGSEDEYDSSQGSGHELFSIWTYPALVDRVTLTDSGFADHLLSNSSGDRYPRAECRRLRL
jgi:hypothetical protein